MTAKQLLATREWTRSGEWPYYQGEGPRYQHSSGIVAVQGFVTRTCSRKTRVWRLYVHGRVTPIRGRFAYVACEAARVLSSRRIGGGVST